jgi:hypothetical protein
LNDDPRFDEPNLLRNHIVVMVVLVSWLALGVVVVGLFNVAKMRVRSAPRRHNVAANAGGQVLASIERREATVKPFRSPPRVHPGAVALPPPQASRRSA